MYIGIDNGWRLHLDSQRLNIRTGSATGGTDTANALEIYKNGETTVSQNVLVYSDANGYSNGWAINMDENTAGSVSRQSNSYKSLFYFQDIRTNSSPNEKHNFGEWDGTNFKPICYFYTSTDGSDDNASNVEVLASGASSSNANAWLNLRSKGVYYGGLNYYSGSNHIYSQLAYRDGSGVNRLRCFMGGSGTFPQANGTLVTSINGTGDFGLKCDPEANIGLEVNGAANIDSSTGNVFTGRSDGGNGNNRRFNLIALADGNGTYGGGMKIQTRNNSNVFQDALFFGQDRSAYFYGGINAYSAGAVGLEVKGDGSGYTQGAIVLRSHPSGSSPEYRGQGVYMFNEGADENWYTGTVYNETTQHRWMVCNQANSSISYDTAQVTHCKFSVHQDGKIGVNNSNPSDSIHVTSADPILRLEASGNNDRGIRLYGGSTEKASILWNEGSANFMFKNLRADANQNYANIGFMTGGGTYTTPSLRLNINTYGAIGVTQGGNATNTNQAPANMSYGSSGQVLTSYGNSAPPRWVTPSSGGYSADFSGYANKFSVGTSSLPSTGEIRATGNITAYYSDERLKDFHGKIENAVDKVKSLNGYYYSENEKAKEYGYEKQDKKQVGVSAQEVEKVLPEIVSLAPFDIAEDETSKSGEDYKTVDYEKLVPLLIEAIKEQQTQIDYLKEKLNGITE